MSYHNKKKNCQAKIKTKKDMMDELSYDLANLQLTKLEDEMKYWWLSRFKSLKNCPICK